MAASDVHFEKETDCFANSLEHILAELERIDLLIRAQVARARRVQQSDAEFQGLYISEQELDGLLSRPVGLPPWATSAATPPASELACALQARAATIARQKAESLRRGTVLRLAALARLFELTAFDADTLLVCLAPELDLRYQRLYAYLQDDVTKKRPSVDLVLNLLCDSFQAKVAARERFTPAGPLMKHRVLEPFEDSSQPKPPLIGKYLRVDERVASYLLGSDHLDARLALYAAHLLPRLTTEELVLPEGTKRCLELLTCPAARPADGSGQKLVLYFQGPGGVGKQTTAEALCRELNVGLLVVDGERLAGLDGADFKVLVQLAVREAALQGSALYWEGYSALLAESKRTWRDTLLAELATRSGLTFLAGENPWEPADGPLTMAFVRIEFTRPNYAERLRLWGTVLDHLPLGVDVDQGALANKFRLTGGQIRAGAATAQSIARRRSPEHPQVAMADLCEACRLHSSSNLSSLARKIKPHYSWDDIILPADRLEQLREICNSVRYRSLVYDEWGFDRKLALGKGLNILFAGPSGTGKTMAADIMTGELGLDLYKIDLSTVVSKYIGETEKNLARIFAEAEASNCILFFDEADALFGKRSEVRDSHDRYANIEINYLLQKMEEHEGVVILATNFRKNMDDAFVRRMHFTVDFPFPNEADRRRIWEQIWPAETPQSATLDLDFMARRFEIAGGNIRNIALAAAFLAASDGGVVNMTHLLHGTRREFQKMGKVVIEGEFGAHREAVDSTSN